MSNSSFRFGGKLEVIISKKKPLRSLFTIQTWIPTNLKSLFTNPPQVIIYYSKIMLKEIPLKKIWYVIVKKIELFKKTLTIQNCSIYRSERRGLFSAEDVHRHVHHQFFFFFDNLETMSTNCQILAKCDGHTAKKLDYG